MSKIWNSFYFLNYFIKREVKQLSWTEKQKLTREVFESTSVGYLQLSRVGDYYGLG